jgi:hypothetical protein
MNPFQARDIWPPGTVVERKYIIVRKLGVGGFGTVYLAEHNVLGDRVIKRLHSQYAEDPQFIARFVKEAQAIARLKGCPQIVKVFDTERTEDGHLILVMEYMPGGDLASLIKKAGRLPGTFQMGCSQGDSDCLDDERPAHEVTITKGFWMGQTEAEWEYAARANTTESRYGDLDEIAWYDMNSGNSTHPAGQKVANRFGLYDMLGNVYKWVADWKAEYAAGPQCDPGGPQTGQGRVLRGGSWLAAQDGVRASERIKGVPGYRSSSVGFRCAGN